MHITYTPEDGDRQEWDFDPGRVRASAAEIIERRFGGTWDEFQAGVQGGNIRARRAMLWHLMVQQHASLRLEDVPDFYADELVVQFSVKELTAIRDRLGKANLPADKREQAMAAIDVEMTEAMEREEGKAPSATSPGTGGTSSLPN